MKKIRKKAMENSKTQYLNVDEFGKDLEEYIDKLKNKELEKLIIKTEAKSYVVVLSVKEYEDLKNLYDKVVNRCQMS